MMFRKTSENIFKVRTCFVFSPEGHTSDQNLENPSKYKIFGDIKVPFLKIFARCNASLGNLQEGPSLKFRRW